MKKAKKLYILLAVVVLVIGLVAIFLFTNDSPQTVASSDDNNSIDYIELANTTDDISKIYTLDYQSGINEQIETLKNKNNYTIKEPLLIANPYGTNTTGVYMYFKTDDECNVSYTISAEGYDDFLKTLNNSNNNGYTTEHEYLLVGIVPGTTNNITVTLTDANENIIDTLNWSYDAPKLLGSEDNVQLEVTTGNSSEPLSDGLYAMLGNRTAEDNEEVDFILLYDNNGTIRSEIPITSYRSCRIIFDDDMMYYSISTSKIAGMNRLGQVTEIFNTGDYKLHHDYIWGGENDLLVLASKNDAKTEEDIIISIDRDTGDVSEIIDLKDLFTNYFNTLNIDEDSDEALDWMHINSIQLINDDSIIISSRETSSIIKIDNIYDQPTVDYMIGSKTFWQESGYNDLVLEQIGDFSLNAGQHCVTYQEDDSLADGQYYLYFYNNNNTVCSTRDYDYSNETNYEGASIGVNGEQSYYDKYLVDEKSGTFELVNRISVTYSGYVSSVQELDDNIIVDSGSAFEASEFDSNNQLIQTVIGTGDTWWYRVFKYDFNNYWFQ
ncbi:aryl-sulfate sulfotransferase [Thomasclavelia saccharogumia]|uniref:aryl-sulfate sulfotransferase n=1 Tax=Thomasclavelia saccharogumia TaxID=341225 RepID=UPI00047A995A|nr:aryl-sulfate sulfotransferase [Thomasclavelia saccharogumia]